ACSDDPGAAQLLDQAAQRGVRTVGYGTGEGGRTPEVRLEFDRLGPESSDVVLHGPGVPAGGPLHAHVAVPGEHNARNAVAAWCAGYELGVPAEEMAVALQAFAGTARRFEDRG